MSNQYKIFAYRIPDVVVYFNNKIKNYQKIDSQGTFKSVNWQEKINQLQHLIDELVLLYGNPPSNNLRFDSLVWCSDKALITKEFTVNEVANSLAKGIWYCLPVSGFGGQYFLSEESQNTLNSLRELGRLEEIANNVNE